MLGLPDMYSEVILAMFIGKRFHLEFFQHAQYIRFEYYPADVEIFREFFLQFFFHATIKDYPIYKFV